MPACAASANQAENERRDFSLSILTNNGKVFTLGGSVLTQPPVPPPVMAPSNSWYKGTTDKSTITEIELKDTYTPTEAIVEQWNADENNNGDIKCYIIGTKLYIIGNGSGKIVANKKSMGAFRDFIKASTISRINLLDTSNVTNMNQMFHNC